MNSLQKMIIPLLSVIIFSCKDDKNDDPGIELITNNELEVGSSVPTGWFSFEAPNPSSGTYEFSYSSEEALSGEKSLKISASTASEEDFGSWGFRFPFNSIENEGRRIELSVWARGDLEGEGMSIVLRGDDGEQESASFTTSQENERITDSFDWKEYKISDEVEPGVTSYAVFFVLLQNTTGTVYFDDVSVIRR